MNKLNFAGIKPNGITIAKGKDSFDDTKIHQYSPYQNSISKKLIYVAGFSIDRKTKIKQVLYVEDGIIYNRPVDEWFTMVDVDGILMPRHILIDKSFEMTRYGT